MIDTHLSINYVIVVFRNCKLYSVLMQVQFPTIKQSSISSIKKLFKLVISRIAGQLEKKLSAQSLICNESLTIAVKNYAKAGVKMF